MPQRGIAAFGSSSAAFAKDRYASSWLKPKSSVTPWSKNFCASGLDVAIGWWCDPIPGRSAAGFAAGESLVMGLGECGPEATDKAAARQRIRLIAPSMEARILPGHAAGLRASNFGV